MKERLLFLVFAVILLLLLTDGRPHSIPMNDLSAGALTLSPPPGIGRWNPAYEAAEADSSSPLLLSWWRRLGARLWEQMPRARPGPGQASAPVPFVVSQIEVTQAVQNLAEPVPLIAGKATVVRAYLESPAGAEVAPIWGTLYASNDSGRSWVAIQPENRQAATAVATLSFERNADDHAMRFTLAPALARGTVLLSLQTRHGEDGQWQQSKQLTLFFDESTPFRIAYLPLQFEGERPTTERIARAHAYMQMIYPVAEVDYFPLPYAAPFQGSKEGVQVTHFLRRLHAFYHYGGWPARLGEPDQFFGWAPHSTWRLDGRADPYWFNNGASQVAFGTDSPVNNAYQMIMAHEIGHNLGRQHPVCAYTTTDWPHRTYGIYDVGYDFGYYPTATPFVHPLTDDFMVGSNCGADIYANKWISAHNYQKLHEALGDRQFKSPAAGQTAAVAPVAGGTGTGPSVYLVSGLVYGDGRAELDTVYQVDPADTPLQTYGSDYCLLLEGTQGEKLSEHCFDLSLADAQRYNRPASFTFALPYAPGGARLSLVRAGQRLAQRTFSAHVPSVELAGPAPGSTLAGRVEIAWNGYDADGDPLSYVLSYSPDAGDSWYHLAYDFTGNRLAVDVDQLPGGDQALFRLMASDGLHTAVATTGPFHVENRPPQLLILLPQDNRTFYQGQTLLLSGYGFDPEDGLLAHAGLHWFSDLAGYLGSGKMLVTRDLPAGRHLISLVASDSNGEPARTTITVEIR
jgi:hypothetical protein